MESRIIDYIIIIAYLIGVALIGIVSGGKQRTLKDYFLGAENIPWWVICFSIVAAETSSLTFISVPGIAYLTNINFLQLAFGFLLGRILVAFLFLPAYFKGELETAYKYLEHRFGKSTRSFASVIFLFTRIAADGVRLFATAIPLYLLLNINPVYAIIIVAVISLIYTYTGGIKGVIWVDFVQFCIYLGGALIAIVYLISLLPDGLSSFIATPGIESKLSLINLGSILNPREFFLEPYTLLSGLIGGMFLSMASHGTDQLIVQRLLAAKEIGKAKKAVIGSGVLIILQFAVFLLVGLLLYSFYGPLNIKGDEIFSKFIIENLPQGISGIIIAGLLAAAMSTLAGSMSSLTSSAMLDIVLPVLNRNYDERKKLLVSRIITIISAGLLTISALLFIDSSTAVVEIALSIASFTYGGLLGTFLLGLINKKANQRGALLGFAFGIGFMIFVITSELVAWTWFTFIGVLVTILAGSVFSLFKSGSNK